MSRREIAALRRKVLDEKRKLIAKKVSIVERKLYDSIFDKIISQLELSDGNLIFSGKNIELSAALDKIFKDLNKNEYFDIIKSFGKDLNQTLSLNKKYFEILEDDKAKLLKASEEVNATMLKRIGLTADGEIIKDGYLNRLISDVTFQKQIKQEILKGITTNKSFVDFKKELELLIVGNDKVDGGLERHLKTFAYDTYEQFNRATSKEYAVKLDLKAFIFAGGKIKTSRCFCKENNGQVFTNDEAEQWRTRLNDGCGPIWDELTDGTYDPITMLGGYNCRHTADYISDTIAKKLRPGIVL